MTTALQPRAPSSHQNASGIVIDAPAILGYRLPQLLARYASEHGVPLEEAELIFQETKKFLATCAQDNSENYSPSEEQDAMWHDFILFTKNYTDFCQTFFGRYLHHVPCDGKKKDPDPCPLKQRATVIFGEITPRLWAGKPSEMARCCGMC